MIIERCPGNEPLEAGWRMAAVRFSTLLGAVKYRIDLQDLPV